MPSKYIDAGNIGKHSFRLRIFSDSLPFCASQTLLRKGESFKTHFKQVSVARLLEISHTNLVSRLQKNGWAFGVSAEFLAWLTDLPVAQVGAVPRYAVLRWALGEDADRWLPLRGKLNRSQQCLSCQCNTRCFPLGPGYGALCPSCFLPATTRDFALNSLCEDVVAFARFHHVPLPSPSHLPPAIARILSSEGCRAQNSYVPCVLCQQEVNSIDHWLSFCQVPPLPGWHSGPPLRPI